MERAIAEINGLKPDIVVCSGDLTTFGFKEEYAAAKRYLDRIDCEVARRRAREPRLPERRLRPFRGAVRRAELRAPQGGITVVAVDSTEPDLDHGQIGRGRYGWIEEQFAAEPSELRDLRAAPSSAADPRDGARAQRRLRRRRRDRVPPARRREPRALGAQARAVRLEAREPVRRQHRHRLDAAPPRQHAALLQRGRGRRDARRRSGGATRSTARSGSSSSTSRPASTRSTPAGSSARSPPQR